jgi:hypothetical protein
MNQIIQEKRDDGAGDSDLDVFPLETAEILMQTFFYCFEDFPEDPEAQQKRDDTEL